MIDEAKSQPQMNGGHYEKLGIEPIEVMRQWFTPEELRGFYRGNILKYIGRYRNKGGMEDLRKAQWYLDELLKLESGSDEKKNIKCNNEQRDGATANASCEEMRGAP